MTTYTFPDLEPSASTWELVSNTRTFVSPLTNAVQTASRKGSFWKVSMQFNNLKGEERSVMAAFLTKLNGREHRFTLYDHAFTRRGFGADTNLVAAASQTGTSLSCTGGAASQSAYAKAGDYIRVGNALHVIVPSGNTDDETYSTDVSGNVAFTIAPPLRQATAASSPFTDVRIDTPVEGVFMLVSTASWDSRPGVVSNFSIECVEDVLA